MTDRRVLFFGDSHVAGVGDPAGMGWVGRVLAESFRLGLPLTGYNLGVRAETSEQVAARWRAEARPRLAATGVDGRVVLSFGANDTTMQDGGLRVPPARSCAALATILDEAADAQLPVLMVGPAPVDDPRQNERIRSLSTAFAGVCRAAGVVFVNVAEPLLASHAWMQEVAAGDGAHPAARGYDALAGVVIAGGWAEWLRGDCARGSI